MDTEIKVDHFSTPQRIYKVLGTKTLKVNLLVRA